MADEEAEMDAQIAADTAAAAAAQSLPRDPSPDAGETAPPDEPADTLPPWLPRYFSERDDENEDALYTLASCFANGAPFVAVDSTRARAAYVISPYLAPLQRRRLPRRTLRGCRDSKCARACCAPGVTERAVAADAAAAPRTAQVVDAPGRGGALVSAGAMTVQDAGRRGFWWEECFGGDVWGV
jgi:hypothetical protein